MSGDQMLFDEMSFDEMSFDQTLFEKVTQCLDINYWNNIRSDISDEF